MDHAPYECDDEMLRQLLQSNDRECDRTLARHLEVCERCQLRLEEFAADDGEWREARDMLTAGDTDAADDDGHWHARPVAWTESMACQLLLPPSHPDMMGRIGRYEVERLIGSGGMGVVFKAFDSELNRPVAVKILAPYLSDSGAARQRFSREARAAAAVVHEHVVAIHNVESDAANPYLVMQYIAGESLADRLKRTGPLELCEILRIGTQVASGLAAAHAQGLVHRDVKPSNILLEEGIERSLLTDFGLARASDDASLTLSGFHPGTPQYMSPEQARGDSVDGRSDLFSLGSVIYAMCTGYSPFRADSGYAVLKRLVESDPRPIREVNPQIPEWLESIVGRLHQKSAEHRISSAEVLARTLEQCLAHVQQPTMIGLPTDYCEPHRKSSGSQFVKRVVAAAGILVLGGSALFFVANRSEKEPADEQAQASVATQDTGTKPESKPAATVKEQSVPDWESTGSALQALQQDVTKFEERFQQNL